MNKFFVYVQTQSGRFVNAFVFEGNWRDAFNVAQQKAYQQNVINPDVQVSPLVN